jgi:hypothetical protein
LRLFVNKQGFPSCSFGKMKQIIEPFRCLPLFADCRPGKCTAHKRSPICIGRFRPEPCYKTGQA